MKLLFWKDKIMRLNKYLSDAGVCSRREADRLTEAGEITVNENARKPACRWSLATLLS